MQINKEWRLGKGPSANRYTHTWAWDGRGHPTQAHPESGKTLTRSSGLQWAPTEAQFWGGIANLLSTFDPDVILTGYSECLLGPSLSEAAARVRPWSNGWGRFPGTPAPALAQLGQQYTQRWAPGELWNGRNVCDVYARLRRKHTPVERT